MAKVFSSEVDCALGAACACASAASTVIGMLVQKEGLTRENKAMFYLGVLIFTVVKPGAQIIALFLAPVSLVAPFASVTILLNAVIVPWFRAERLSRQDVWVGIMLMAGCAGTMVVGPRDTHMRSYAELCALAAESRVCTLGLACTTLILAVRLKVATRAQPSELAEASPSSLGVLLAAFVPAAASALNNVVIKVLMEGLLSGPQLSLTPLLGALAFTAFLQVWSTTIGVQLYDMLVYVPIQVAEQILVTVVYGAVFFQEAPSNLAAFVGSTLSIILGVLMSQARPTEGQGTEKTCDKEDQADADYTLMGA